MAGNNDTLQQSTLQRVNMTYWAYAAAYAQNDEQHKTETSSDRCQ